MSDGTSLLFDLPGFRVVSCELTALGVRRLLVMQSADEHGCPRCGVLAGGKPYDVRESRIKDLPFGPRPLLVIWRKRRYRCVEPRCSQRVFTERSMQVPPSVDRPAAAAVGAGRVPVGAGAVGRGRPQARRWYSV